MLWLYVDNDERKYFIKRNQLKQVKWNLKKIEQYKYYQKTKGYWYY